MSEPRRVYQFIPFGTPGRYDDLCNEIVVRAEATGGILMIVNGNKGNGMSVALPAETLAKLPTVLRFMADQIEQGRAHPG